MEILFFLFAWEVSIYSDESYLQNEMMAILFSYSTYRKPIFQVKPKNWLEQNHI